MLAAPRSCFEPTPQVVTAVVFQKFRVGRREPEVGAEQAGQRGGGESAEPQRQDDLDVGDPILDAARLISFLPVVQGGLGLRSMALLSPAAYWAAWADVLPIVEERVPDLAERVMQELESDDSRIHSVTQVQEAEAVVNQHWITSNRPDFPLKPTWRDLAAGDRPPSPLEDYDGEPGHWPHGWQFFASLGLVTHHREHAVLPSLDAKAQARLRSQSGAHAGDHITALPMSEYTVANPLRFNGMLRRRARLPIAIGQRHCRAHRCQRDGCSLLDCFGDHGAACQRTGALKRRGAAVERAFRPLWEEAPVDASEHPLVRELVPSVPESDGRQADVFVRGMAIGNGLPVVGDMCMGSVLHANGTPYTDAATVDGKAIERLTDQKREKCPKRVASDRVHYVVLACEGGAAASV